MSDTLIKVEGVSKKFCRDLKRSLWYGMQDLGNELLGRCHGGKGELRPDEFWAIKDVSFELKRGERLGLIGHNGAGKTTLLRMLNGLIKPDKGRVEIRGRVGALIALGAGFNPILTGRENIYVNASVLGLSKREIDEKIDEIIDFAEIGEFIDAPVQSYSSGMQVRLGFAVATTINPDVLLLDEILAVGDAGFRSKCYKTIASLADRCALIFVSHSPSAIARLCGSCLVLDKGKHVYLDNVVHGIQKYNELFDLNKTVIITDGIRLMDARFHAEYSDGRYIVSMHGSLRAEFTLESDKTFDKCHIHMGFISVSGESVAEFNTVINDNLIFIFKGLNSVVIDLDNISLNPGTYSVSLVITSTNLYRHLLWVQCGWNVRIDGKNIGNVPYQLSGKISCI